LQGALNKEINGGGKPIGKKAGHERKSHNLYFSRSKEQNNSLRPKKGSRGDEGGYKETLLKTAGGICL